MGATRGSFQGYPGTRLTRRLWKNKAHRQWFLWNVYDVSTLRACNGSRYRLAQSSYGMRTALQRSVAALIP
jgi:hypothetical protein